VATIDTIDRGVVWPVRVVLNDGIGRVGPIMLSNKPLPIMRRRAPNPGGQGAGRSQLAYPLQSSFLSYLLISI
jgi:hypothetical protein